jgi:hypothetical protein
MSSVVCASETNAVRLSDASTMRRSGVEEWWHGSITPGKRSCQATLYRSDVAILDVVRFVEIERDAEVVRRQFGDVAHHAAAGLHRGVVFEVIEDDGARCSYRQVSSVGPLTLRQEMALDRTESGPLVNRIVAGQFAGGAISFDVQSCGDGRSVVEARLTAPIPLAMRVVTPILRAQVGKQLAAALVEDKADLEGGAYGQA